MLVARPCLDDFAVVGLCFLLVVQLRVDELRKLSVEVGSRGLWLWGGGCGMLDFRF